MADIDFPDFSATARVARDTTTREAGDAVRMALHAAPAEVSAR